ncbi:MAG: hypothetical protein FWF73_06550 [Spirochaetes bacterium]|nr:hypothetical protein [Spirochaetota bacterium]
MRKLIFLKPIVILAIAAGFSAIVMLLWNWLMPAIFGLGEIDYWQALGLLILSRVLFGHFGGGHLMHGSMRRRMHAGKFMREKWMKMTPEERKEFVNKRMDTMRGGRFCRHDFDSDVDENNTSKNNE